MATHRSPLTRHRTPLGIAEVMSRPRICRLAEATADHLPMSRLAVGMLAARAKNRTSASSKSRQFRRHRFGRRPRADLHRAVD
jgi:hypothetical protein